MNRVLSEEDRAFRDELRAFLSGLPDDVRIFPYAGREIAKETVVAAQRALNAGGWAVPHWPAEWGGRDLTPLQRHLYLEELRLAGLPNPLAFNVNMVGPVIAAFGTPEQKERFLPATANLDIWWSQGFSEPDAGSDLASLRTTAVRDGDEYVVNGQKTWTTLGQYGDWIFMLVRTDPAAPKKQLGISFLLVDMRSPGVQVRPIELVDGSFEVNEVFFDDVRVPAENLVGAEGQGWSIAKFLLGNERVGVAPVAATKLELAETKAALGDRLDDPLLAARVAELENDVFALELTALRVVAHSDEGRPHPASSVLKLDGTERQQAVSTLTMDAAGPAALALGAGADATDLPADAVRASAHYLNLRKASIYGGSNEVQRQIIARTILGL